VLHVATVRDASARYYLDNLGDELALVTPAHAFSAGRWLGASAGPLGLAGPVAAGPLSTLLGGCHPNHGRPLVRSRRTVVGFDLTFSVPKGVSLLFGLGQREASDVVALAHREAVDRALGYLERRAVAVRRGSREERVSLGADGLVGAGFTHCLSRSGDPHLHTHVVVANLAHGSDGRWSAVDGRGLFAHARAAGALHDAHLRSVLTDQLGVGWSFRSGRGWEVADADPMLLAAFSGRSAEIGEALANHGGRSSRARHVAWATTRGPKLAGATAEGLAADWSRRARAAGDRAFVLRSFVRDAPLDEYRFASEIAALPPSGVRRRDVVAAWATASVRAEALDLERAVDHWVAAAPGRGVAEDASPPVSVLPAPHLLRALGPRPVESAGQPIWRMAAGAIERYRARWGVSGPEPLERSTLGAMPARRLADHLEATRTVRDALARLGGRRGTSLEREATSIGRW
jgi:conjugative relaxase-like TrwC/TraI family protein